MNRILSLLGTIGLTALLAMPGPVAGKQFSDWAAPQKVDEINGNSSELNTPSQDGCPIQSPDGLSLYLASNRPRFVGDTRTDLDIWVAHRTGTDAPFGAPVNIGEPINSLADDFCPTPVQGKGLFFVSARVTATSCGLGDIYFARLNPAHGWTAPQNLGCQVNSAAGEAGPSYFEANGRTFLYFSSGPDIFASEQQADGSFGPAAPVAELNSTAGDFRPNVRKDGLEIVFDSNRDGTIGLQDLWFATRDSVEAPWSTPVNAGPTVNSVANETRGSFSWDGGTLYFGRTPGPEGSTDIFVTTRD
jgi:hypothetical protein